MSQSETKTCQSCHKDFIIESEDFDFYKKIDVPAPTWCPGCRNLRRMAWRENRLLYKDVCKLCEKSIITVHAPGGPFKVYCRECFMSDKWDSMDYGRDYDFNTPFFTQYRKLMEDVPRPSLTGNNLVNSDFTHACSNVKNCYHTFWSYFSENSQNDYGLLFSRDTYYSYTVDNSDHTYESLHSNRLYRVNFGYFSDECLDSSFLYDCVGCSDCFGCINIRKQKYCIFNKKYSKEEYFNNIKEWDIGSYKKLQEARKKFKELYVSTPHRFAHIRNSQNVTGDIIRDAKDCKMCFSALDGVQNCKYLYFGGLNLKDSYDVSAGGVTSELLYEVFGITNNAQRCLMSIGGGNSRDTLYCDWVSNSSNIFGSISLKNKKYCILNKQYTKEEYENLLPKIKEQMNQMPYVDKKGRIYKFGEFFPTELSAYAYNEAFGFDWYPKTKEEVLNEGWRWQDQSERSYKITVKYEDLPDHIKDTDDSIIDETISCEHNGLCDQQCITAFRITKEELEFHRNMNIALPRLCTNCRNSELLKWRNGYNLWTKNCMCKSSNHSHNGNCTNSFETTFPPESLEILYCDQCYKSEFI
ncbi:MAG: hypothetical protein WCW90_01080 [Candidatus Paceibacterota bacterium]